MHAKTRGPRPKPELPHARTPGLGSSPAVRFPARPDSDGIRPYLPAPAGIFIAANNYSVQKNVTRNGTLKSSVQPWKIETTA